MNGNRRRVLAGLAAAAAQTVALPGRAAASRPVRIGYSLPLTGAFAIPALVSQERPTVLWAEQINSAGGLDVQGVRRPVEIIRYDDRGEADITTQHCMKLMTADKVDLLLAPWGSKATSAVAPLANRYGYPLLAPTGMSRKLLDLNLPYFFSLLQEPDRMMGAVVDLLRAEGIRRLAILYMDDVFGTENLSGLNLALHGRNMDVTVRRGYAPGSRDLAAHLRAIRDSNAEAFIGITYPDESLLATRQAREIGFAPKFFYTAVGTCFPWFREQLGSAAEGVLGMGSWNAKSNPAAKAFFDAHVKRFGQEPDRWAAGHAYAGLQILADSVQSQGLDRRALRAWIAGREFQTILGPVRFTAGENVATPGALGQWQGREFEIVWPPARATAKLAFPQASRA